MSEHAAHWTGSPTAKADCYSTGLSSVMSSAVARNATRAVLDSGGFVFPASILTVGERIEAGEHEDATALAALTAGADEAEADTLAYTDEQAGIVVEDSDRIDLDVVEHTRQSRLRAWQEQRP